MNDLSVFESVPQHQEVEGLVIALDPALGLVVHAFPERTAFVDESLAVARQTRGVVQVEGGGGIGSRITITAANGEAVYELTDRVRLQSGAQKGQTGFAATRRHVVPRFPGATEVMRTYETLAGFADEWPVYAGFHPRFLTISPHVQKVGAFLTVRADGVTGSYLLRLPHPMVHGGWLGERSRLVTPDGIVVGLPTASMQTKIHTQ